MSSSSSVHRHVQSLNYKRLLTSEFERVDTNFEINSNMIFHETNDDDDLLLRCKQFSEQDDLDADQLQRLAAFNLRLVQESQDYFLEHSFFSPYHIKEDEDIILRLTKLSVESDTEMKTELDDHRSLADKESHGGSEHNIEEEDILLLLTEVSVESDPELETEQNDLPQGLDARRSVAEKESHGGFKHKIEKNNREYFLQDPACLQYDIMASVLEAANAGEKEKKDVHGDLKDRIKHKTTTEKVEPYDLGFLVDVEEIVLKFYQFIDHIIPMLKDTQKVRFEVQDKLNFLKKVNDLLLTSSKSVDKLERMKNDDQNHGKTQNIREILVQLMEFNAHLVERSFHHGIAFPFNNKKNEFNAHLRTVLSRIRGMEDDRDSREKYKKMNNKRCGFNSVPQLPDGFER